MMAIPTKQRVSLAEFENFIQQPGNSEKRYELIGGEIVEVPSNGYVSVVADLISFFIRLYIRTNNIQGHLTGEGAGYKIDGQILAPDVAFVRRLPPKEVFAPDPPELAVEVISRPHSNAEQADLRRKLTHYLNANVVVWVVDYVARTVEVYAAGQDVLRFGEDEVVPGGDVLPGFQLPVKDIFPEEE